MEEYVPGEICSYDAIVNSKGTPLFETGNITPISIMDCVNDHNSIKFYIVDQLAEDLKACGRACLKAFKVHRRFVHLEFFRLLEDHPYLGKKGQVVGLEVNMRPSGGPTPDMINFAYNINCYQYYADMMIYDKLRHKTKTSPAFCVYEDENGDYTLNSQAAFLPNPVSLLEITDKTTKERLLATAFVEVKPINDLTLKANFGIDRNYQKRSVYMPKTTLYGQKKGGQADVAQYDKSDYLMELTANYTKRWGEHNFSALAGYSFQRFTDESLGAGNSQFLIDGFLFNNLGSGAYPKPSVSSSASKDEMASFFGRVNYSFKDRYLLT